ncbi:hypothetical protein [Leadbetterella sp. DM7]|uniref:hypothetical protein n=1 Tax=Leadbetterella sp. DM7 TaxID=3235085 RepID=UPI00349E5714
MIIYGVKATPIATENISDSCSNCETPDSIQMILFNRYAHVFWIPFFPIGKTGTTQCLHCKQVLQKKEFTGNLRGKYEALKSGSKTPFWTFSGLALLSVLIIWGMVSSKQKDKKNAELILDPQQGDIYEIKKDYAQYTLYKVDHVDGDTAFVLLNEYETNKVSGLTGLKQKGDEAFIREPLPMLKADLKSMLEKGEILDIGRE